MSILEECLDAFSFRVEQLILYIAIIFNILYFIIPRVVDSGPLLASLSLGTKLIEMSTTASYSLAL
jgi:hydroxymethylglutaryl-CoA reductase